MKYFGFAECNNCHDREGPWVQLDNRFLCEKCYEKEKKMNKFQMEEKKIFITQEINEGDVLILENGNYEIITSINIETGIIKSTLIDTENMEYCRSEITIEKFMNPENMKLYYGKMEGM